MTYLGTVTHILVIAILMLATISVTLLILLIRRSREGHRHSEGPFLLTTAAFVALIGAVSAAMYFLHSVLLLHKAYWVVPIFGALGGLVGCLMRNGNHLPLGSFDSKRASVHLGFVGDMVLGLGGASAIVFLFENTLKFDPDQKSSYPLLISVCFLAGVFGRLVVQEAGQKMVKEALSRATRAEEGVERLIDPSVMTYILESREQYRAKRYSEALGSANKALQMDPTSVRAMNVKARALKQLGRLDEAYALIKEALSQKFSADQNALENRGVVLYNKVCYGLLLGISTDNEALTDLEESFRMFPRGRIEAASDPDLIRLHQNPEFKRLIETRDEVKL